MRRRALAALTGLALWAGLGFASPLAGQIPGSPEGPVLQLPTGPSSPGLPPSDPLPPADDDWAADDDAAAGDGNGLPEEYRKWLQEVTALITDEERAAFLALTKDYQRDAFIDRFWRQRDPYPDTGVNELRRRWEERVLVVRQRYRTFDDVRATVLLLNGPPPLAKRVRCRASFWPMEIWIYPGGSDQLSRPFALIFYQKGASGRWRLWNPGEGSSKLSTFGGGASGCLPEQIEYLRAARRLIAEEGPLGYMTTLVRVQKGPPPVGGEWVATFGAYSTDLPQEAETFGAELSLDFPGWFQNRTVAQGTLTVPVSEVELGELAGHRSYNLLLTGEVLTDGSEGEPTLFDSFRYKFDLPADTAEPAGALPLVFQRYLRPGGPYALVLKLEDLNAGRFHRREVPFSVPRVSGEELPPPTDPKLAAVLAEANAAIASGETSVKLVPPIGELFSGLVRFDTLVSGAPVQRVTFTLDGEPIFTKTRPPYSVELDLGDFPRTHELVATAFDDDGVELARDELLVNAEANRFRVRLLEPQRGKRYEQSLRARAEVVAPRGETVERVEIFLNEQRLATLYQPPYVQPIVLPESDPTLFVRAVAFLTDGSSTEDAVFVNAPDFTDDLDVQLVELFTSVLDRSGRPVEGLGRERFSVVEDGVPQQIVRFERVEDLPIHATILLDVSASMEENLGQARQAALRFFEQAIASKDRAAIITFNDRPYLAVEFTNRLESFAGGLAGLKAERGTALYDSVIYGLFYFTGIRGQRAMLVLSDGKDESSRFGYNETLDYARRAGITVYPIGLGLSKADSTQRKKLTGLADETGGRSFFIDSIAELEGIYETIQEELRSKYLIAYQSSNTKRDDEFRTVDLKLDERGLEVKTIRGYYP